MPSGYKSIDDCRTLVIDYADHLASGTDDNDTDQRASASTKRYKQDLRWFDHWLDDHDIEDVTDLTPPEASRLGRTLGNEFSGTTGRYRWDRIHALYDYLESMDLTDENPLARWNDSKSEKWGLSKSNEQDQHLNDGEKYAVDAEDIEAMEEAVEEDRVRNQLLIRLAWHTAARRGEIEAMTVGMLDENKREITLPSSVTKNNRKRVVGYNRSLDGLLHRWLHGGLRDEYLGGRDHDHLFVGTRGAPLSGEAINDVIVKAADNAGINRKLYADANSPDGEPNRWKVSSHNVRHGAATRLVNKTDMTDLYSISRYLGHSSVEITEKRYVEYDPEVGVRGVRDYLPD